jgi:methyltransferase (TIGR00027 family)
MFADPLSLRILGADADAALRVFEADHPASRAWTGERLATAAIAQPDALTLAPLDFERETLADALLAAGFDPGRQTCITWLGVVPHLTEQTVLSALGYMAGVSGGAHAVFDYANPVASLDDDARIAREAPGARHAALGEGFRSFFRTDSLRARSRMPGFRKIEDCGPREIAARFFPGCARAGSDRGGHILRASRPK